MFFRYTIKVILNHPFFQEDYGVKVNLVEAEPGVDSDTIKPVDTVKLLLQLEDPKKRKDKHKENEAIQFDFNLGTDQPEKVTLELVSKPCEAQQIVIISSFFVQLKQVSVFTVICTPGKSGTLYFIFWHLSSFNQLSTKVGKGNNIISFAWNACVVSFTIILSSLTVISIQRLFLPLEDCQVS